MDKYFDVGTAIKIESEKDGGLDNPSYVLGYYRAIEHLITYCHDKRFLAPITKVLIGGRWTDETEVIHVMQLLKVLREGPMAGANGTGLPDVLKEYMKYD